MTSEGAKGAVRKLMFHTEHEKINSGILGTSACSALPVYLVKFPRFIILGHFSAFLYERLVLAFLKPLVCCSF